jgi:hypothetical protein
LEEWALHILHPDQEFQLKELHDKDSETEQRLERVVSSQREKCQKCFKITTTVFTSAKDNIASNTENNDLEGLDTNTNRHDGLSN